MVDEVGGIPQEYVDDGTDNSKKHTGIFDGNGEEVTIEYEGLQTGSDGGKKCDDGKRELSLLFDAPDALEVVTKVLEFGKAKYGRCNWKSVDIQRYKDALLRHFNAISKGEDWDDGVGGTGQLHWGNIVCCALFSLQITIDEIKKKMVDESGG